MARGETKTWRYGGGLEAGGKDMEKPGGWELLDASELRAKLHQLRYGLP